MIMVMQIQTCVYLTTLFKCPMHLDVHAPAIPNQHTPMQSMGSIEVLPPNSLNNPLIWIINLKPDAPHT
jgi:hypothetical protein